MKAILPLVLCSVLLGAAVPARAQSQPSPKILFSVDVPPGSSPEVEAIAARIQADAQTAFRTKYPCLDSMAMDDIESLLSVAKDRALLGTPGHEKDVAAIATAMERDVIIHLSATGMGGGRTSLSGVAIDGKTAQALARKSAIISDSDVAAMTRFAEELVAGIGLKGVKCPGPWEGTLAFKLEHSERTQKSGAPYEVTALHSARCIVNAEHPREGVCSASITKVTKERCPSGVDCSTTLSGKAETTARVYFGVDEGKVVVLIDSMKIPVEISGPGAFGGKGPIDHPLGNWRVEAPAGSDSLSQSGTQTLPLAKSDTVNSVVTVTWEMRRVMR